MPTIKHPFFEGAVVDDPGIAIESQGFNCPNGDFEAGPHPLWCVIKVYPRWLRFAAASWEPVVDDGALVLAPQRAVTSAGKVIYIMTEYTVFRQREQVVPPKHVQIPSDVVLPFVFQKIAAKVTPRLPPEESLSADWSAERLIKGLLWNRWSNGTKGTPEVTVKDCVEYLRDDRYSPPYDGYFAPEQKRLIEHFENIVGDKGPDFPARELLID